MARFVFLLPLILLAACERKAEPPKPNPKARIISPVAVPAPPPSKDQKRASDDAADALRHYYALIGAGDYEQAYRLRTESTVTFERFTANFAAYERYSALVGEPSRPVTKDGFDYVQLPVMITGNFKGGKPFGSSGNVLMRRRAGGSGWHVLADR